MVIWDESIPGKRSKNCKGSEVRMNLVYLRSSKRASEAAVERRRREWGAI